MTTPQTRTCPSNGPTAPTAPDYAALFPARPHRGPVLHGDCASRYDGSCAACRQLVTPRVAWLLAAGADALLTDADALVDALPPAAARHADENPGWVEQLRSAVATVSAWLSAGSPPVPGSTGDVAALHLVIEAARTALTDPGEPHPDLAALPVHSVAGHDADLGWALDEALTDVAETLVSLEFLTLYDGHPADPAATHLLPGHWFPAARGR